MTYERLSYEIPRRFEAHPGPSDELDARVRAAVAQTSTARTRSPRHLLWSIAALPCAVAVALIGRFAIFGRSPLRIDLTTVARDRLIIGFVLICALTIGATLIAVRPGRYGLGSTALALCAACAGVTPGYVLISVLGPPRTDGAAAVAAVARWHPWGLPCVLVAATVATLALAALTWGMYGAVPACARLRGAALGAASGAWAGLALFVHCPAAGMTHIAIGHVLPIALFTFVGTFAICPFLRLHAREGLHAREVKNGLYDSASPPRECRPCHLRPAW